MKITCPICRMQFQDSRIEQCPQCQIPVKSYIEFQHHQAMLFNLGLIAAKTKQFVQACEYFSAVVHWYPADIMSRNALAMVCCELGDYARARFHLDRILELSPDNPLAKKGIEVIEKLKSVPKKNVIQKKVTNQSKKAKKQRNRRK